MGVDIVENFQLTLLEVVLFRNGNPTVGEGLSGIRHQTNAVRKHFASNVRSIDVGHVGIQAMCTDLICADS